MRRFGVAIAATAIMATIVAAPVGAAAPPFTVVAGGLHSPRGLTFGPGGRLYVAQAGDGSGQPGVDGLSHTGAITEIIDPAGASPSTRTVIDGLASYGALGDSVGVDGISAFGNGGIYAIMGESPNVPGLPKIAGALVKVSTDGYSRVVANVGAFDYAWSAAHKSLSPRDFPDSNPYGVFAVAGKVYVADAGTNTLDEVRPNGSIRIVAYFPDNALADATPTCVARGPDGALYVGDLALVDSIAAASTGGTPAAKVYRVNPAATGDVTQRATVWATGLFPINGCAFGPDGTFYASQLFTGFDATGPSGGDVVKIAWHNGSSDAHMSLTGGNLPLPGGVAVAADGTVYASMLSAFAPTGAVVRLANK